MLYELWEKTDGIRCLFSRIIAFSTVSISEVTVRIDNEQSQKASHVEGPLYALPWEPANYASGIHHLEVVVKVGYMLQLHYNTVLVYT